MFLHLGGDLIVAANKVIGIFNYDLIKNSDITKEFMQVTKDEGFIEFLCSEEKGKSFIITNEKTYVSAISPSTLKKRGNEFSEKNSNIL